MREAFHKISYIIRLFSTNKNPWRTWWCKWFYEKLRSHFKRWDFCCPFDILFYKWRYVRKCQMFLRICILKNFGKFTGRHQDNEVRSLKRDLSQAFSYNFGCKQLRNFIKYLNTHCRNITKLNPRSHKFIISGLEKIRIAVCFKHFRRKIQSIIPLHTISDFIRSILTSLHNKSFWGL